MRSAGKFGYNAGVQSNRGKPERYPPVRRHSHVQQGVADRRQPRDGPLLPGRQALHRGDRRRRRRRLRRDGGRGPRRAGRAPSRHRVIGRERNLGKGASVREGVLAAAGQVVLFCDDDLSTPIDELDKALAALEAGADVVIGSRALAGLRHPGPPAPAARVAGQGVQPARPAASSCRGTATPSAASRPSAGGPAKDIFGSLRTPGFGFDVEVLVLCRERGYRVAEIPVAWCDVRPSRVRMFKGSWGMIKDLRRIRRRQAAPGLA
ncbi:MAG: glycosyltransferase [Sphingobacterium sp.]|nr:glycosyltransferase [Sphingobacterium sp.]